MLVSALFNTSHSHYQPTADLTMTAPLEYEEKKVFDELSRADNIADHEQEVDAPNINDDVYLDARSTAESELPPPPDGGLHAWLKVFGGFLIYINIWSVICSPSCANRD